MDPVAREKKAFHVLFFIIRLIKTKSIAIAIGMDA